MNRKISTLWAFLGLLASLSVAQTWRGAEAVTVQVNDSKGRAVPGARVVFTFQGIPGDLGPDIVATDTKGRAVVAELKPGPWQVEVVHPDYLSFVAMVEVRRDKKPLISASFLEAGGRSLNPVKVKLSKGDEREASPALEARAPAPPAEPEASIAEIEETPSTPVAAVPPSRPKPSEPPPGPEPITPSPGAEPPAVSPPTVAEAPPPAAVAGVATAKDTTPALEPETVPEAQPELDEPLDSTSETAAEEAVPDSTIGKTAVGAAAVTGVSQAADAETSPTAPTTSEPDSALLPDQPPLAVQLVVSVEDQLKVTLSPWSTVC